MNASTVDITTGTEGPNHDPYGYEEITVTRQNGRMITIHLGLDEYVTLNGRRCVIQNVGPWFTDAYYKAVLEEFESQAGITVKAARNAWNRKQYTCRSCGRYDEIKEAVPGFPGETLFICVCGSVAYGDFNESAII